MSCITAVAVKILECEATRKIWSVVSVSPVPIFETPYALLNWTSPSNQTATCAPGARSFQTRVRNPRIDVGKRLPQEVDR